MPVETSVKGWVRFTRSWTILGPRHHVLHLIWVFLLDGVDDLQLCHTLLLGFEETLGLVEETRVLAPVTSIEHPCAIEVTAQDKARAVQDRPKLGDDWFDLPHR